MLFHTPTVPTIKKPLRGFTMHSPENAVFRRVPTSVPPTFDVRCKMENVRCMQPVSHEAKKR